MKKTFNKIKLGLSAFWLSIISFFPKVFWQGFWTPNDYNKYTVQWMYWVPPIQDLYWVPSPIAPALTASKVVQRLLIWVTFIVWIVNLIKIRKIDDKVQKKKRIKKTIIIMSILIILIVACIITIQLLKR